MPSESFLLWFSNQIKHPYQDPDVFLGQKCPLKGELLTLEPAPCRRTCECRSCFWHTYIPSALKILKWISVPSSRSMTLPASEPEKFSKKCISLDPLWKCRFGMLEPELLKSHWHQLSDAWGVGVIIMYKVSIKNYPNHRVISSLGCSCLKYQDF